MSQQGSDHHIFKQLGRDLEAKRKIEDDPEAIALVKSLRDRGHTGEAVRRFMLEHEAEGR